MSSDTAFVLAGALLALGLWLLRRPRPFATAPPPSSVERATEADLRQRLLDARTSSAEAEWAAAEQLAERLRQQADEVDPNDASAVAELMNGGPR